MEVASVRLSQEEKEFLEKLVSEGNYNSASDALKAGLYELMAKYKLEDVPWKTREEVRKHFSKKVKKLHGLEEIHNEED